MKRTAEFFKNMDEILTSIEEILVAGLLLTMTLAIFFAVTERFFIQTGVTWLEELARYLSVWATFIGSALAAKKGAHIGIEAFVQILPEKFRQKEQLIVYAICMLFSLLVFGTGISFLCRLIETNQLSPALRINVAWAYAAVPIGCCLMAVHYFIKLVLGLIGNETIKGTNGGEV